MAQQVRGATACWFAQETFREELRLAPPPLLGACTILTTAHKEDLGEPAHPEHLIAAHVPHKLVTAYSVRVVRAAVYTRGDIQAALAELHANVLRVFLQGPRLLRPRLDLNEGSDHDCKHHVHKEHREEELDEEKEDEAEVVAILDKIVVVEIAENDPENGDNRVFPRVKADQVAPEEVMPEKSAKDEDDDEHNRPRHKLRRRFSHRGGNQVKARVPFEVLEHADDLQEKREGD